MLLTSYPINLLGKYGLRNAYSRGRFPPLSCIQKINSKLVLSKIYLCMQRYEIKQASSSGFEMKFVRHRLLHERMGNEKVGLGTCFRGGGGWQTTAFLSNGNLLDT